MPYGILREFGMTMDEKDVKDPVAINYVNQIRRFEITDLFDC